MLKRALDLSVASVGLVVSLPLLVVLAAFVGLTSPGPVLFVQERLGLDGRPFRMFKFRTMVDGAEHMGTGLFSYEDDDRVTRVGRILRMTSLDELPQIFNVLRGEMSVVGPRPPVVNELGPFEEFTEEMLVRFTVKPGITGMAQVSGRNDLTWAEKIRFDNEYVRLFRRYGVLADLYILVRSIWVVARFRGVVEKERSDGDDRVA